VGAFVEKSELKVESLHRDWRCGTLIDRDAEVGTLGVGGQGPGIRGNYGFPAPQSLTPNP